MKKCLAIISCVAVLFSFIGCASTDVKSSNLRGEEAVMATKSRMIIDYQGGVLGQPIPEWVNYVSAGQYANLPEVMPGLRGKKVFIATERGDNLDFLKTWARSVSIKTKVADIFESNIALAAETSLEGVQVKGKSSTTKAIRQLTEALTSVTVTGLEEQGNYWVQTARVDKDGNETDMCYEYYLVYTMDQAIFDAQINQALNSIENLNTESEALKEIVRDKMEEQVLY